MRTSPATGAFLFPKRFLNCVGAFRLLRPFLIDFIAKRKQRKGRNMGQKGLPVQHYSGAGSKRQLKKKRAQLRRKSRRR